MATSRFRTLDGLRALAIVLVFLAHPADPFWQVFHGATGVTLFFVLSGFLITTLLLREERKNGRVAFGSFYIRRFFRIYPMFLGVLVLYCVLIFGLGFEPDRRELFRDAIPYILLFYPEHMIFSAPAGPYPPFDGAWSIGIEEKFYFVWPILGFLLLAAVKKARIPVLVSLAALSLAAGLSDSFLFLAPYQHLAYGAIAAVLLDSATTYSAAARLGRPGSLLALLSAALVLQFAVGDEVSMDGDLYWLHGLVFALLLTGIVTTRSRGVRWLASGPLAFLAAISYVFYLLHNFLINAVESVVPAGWGLPGSLAAAALSFVLAVGVSWLVHRLYEEPLRKYGVRLSKRLAARRAGSDQRVATLDPIAP